MRKIRKKKQLKKNFNEDRESLEKNKYNEKNTVCSSMVVMSMMSLFIDGSSAEQLLTILWIGIYR